MNLPSSKPANPGMSKDESGAISLEVLILEVAELLVAVRARKVIRLQSFEPELLHTAEPDRLPGLIGFLGWHDTTFPLLNLATLLDLPAQSGQQVLVVERNGQQVGFLVQNIQQIERMSLKDVRLLPVLIEENRLKPVVWAFWERQTDQILSLIDLLACLDEAGWQQLEELHKSVSPVQGYQVV